MTALRALAPAKINLGLVVGPVRTRDRRHEIASVMQSISLADEVVLEPGAAGEDELICPGVSGPPEDNLAAASLRAFRAATGWSAPPLRVEIVKRIPVAGGLGGGSADAGAVLRLAHAASGLGDLGLLRELAADLGADVPAQVLPGRWLATAAGERLEHLPDPAPPLELLLLPLDAALPTAAVYAEADRLGRGRPARAVAERAAALHAQLAAGQPLPADARLLENDLQAAAIALCPEISQALAEADAAGVELAVVSGSGPTVLGLFPRGAGPAQLSRVARALAARVPGAARVRSVGAAHAAPAALARGEPRRRADGSGRPRTSAQPADGAVRHNQPEGG
jgi:4-diphosphocytidyl-2-C-methyl-D-erythritol kinase